VFGVGELTVFAELMATVCMGFLLCCCS
jgi:hypothetical protein